MNKEFVKANKEVFEYWLDGGKIWINSCGTWVIKDKPTWDGHTCKYVQDDEYAEIRKAKADGKVIEAFVSRSNGCGGFESDWYSGYEITHSIPVDSYRIKPDEPKFKVGDWVRLKIFDRTVHKVTALNIRGIGELPKPLLSNFNGNVDSTASLELWEPQADEWCWFKDRETAIPRLFSFSCMNESKYRTHLNQSWKYCEPFIGILPNGCDK